MHIESNRLIREVPEDERPYEKCERYGPASLSDTELLAVILRTGCRGQSALTLSDRILHHSPVSQGLTGIFHMSLGELCELKGVGRVKAIQVQCIGELSKRIARKKASSRIRCKDPETIADYYMESLRHEEQEHVICMMLDTKNHLIGDVWLTKGTVNLSLISPREIFLAALAHHAVSVILVHNHPSGDVTPSGEDLRITRRIGECGRLLGIRLLDHIIIGDCCCYSMCREGLLASQEGS